MRRSFVDVIKGIFYSFCHPVSAVEPVQARVENARMSQTRLKALKPIDPEKDLKMPVTVTPVDVNDPQTIPQRITTLAHMSHYRLEAYVATLPVEKPENLDEFDKEHATTAAAHA
jgi:hypothetical protein